MRKEGGRKKGEKEWQNYRCVTGTAFGGGSGGVVQAL